MPYPTTAPHKLATLTMATDTDPNTARLAALDHAHVWHPFTPMRQWCDTDPLIIARGDGPYLFDTDGRRYIDGISSLWCNVHGHRHPALDQAIRDQLDRVAHTTMLGLASPPSIELAARLVALAGGKTASEKAEVGSKTNPSPHATLPLASDLPTCDFSLATLQKVFYSDAGATALEVAFKMAVGYWHHRGQPDKTRLIGLQGAYHGDTAASMSVGYSDLFHRPFRSMTFPVDWFPNCDPLRASNHQLSIINHQSHRWPSEDPALMNALRAHSLATLRVLLERQADRTAAIVIEPVIQGAAGMIAQPPGFLRGVRDLATEYNVLLICDEVATGFGRTGLMFAFHSELAPDQAPSHSDCTNTNGRSSNHQSSIINHQSPDLLCLAKGLTAGYLPLAATLTTDAIYDAFLGEPHERKTLYHGHTYTGNPLACAVALASLDLFDQPFDSSPDLLTHIRASADLIHEKLHPLRNRPHIADIRQRGLMVGIELKSPASGTFDFTAPLGKHICDRLRHRGILLRPLGNVIVLMPIPATPLDVLNGMLDHLVDVILHDTPSTTV